MPEDQENRLKQTIKELLVTNSESETRNDLLEKLIRRYMRTSIRALLEFEPLMSDSMKKRFEWELNGIKHGLL